MTRTLLTISLLVSVTFLFAQKVTITLEVKGIKEVKGVMSIALYDNEEDFTGKDNYVKAEEVQVNSKEFIYVFKDIPHGTYAIAIYHDVDKDGKLSKNWIGMPKEPFGFSNDAKGRMGPPDFEDAAFKVDQDTEVVINLMEL